MLDAVAKCGPGFVAPSPKTEWLDRVKSDISLQLKDTEKEWVTTGCTIIAEAWTDNKSRALINFSVSSPSRIFFHKSVDASSYFKNSKCLADLFDSVIQDIGQEHIVQIIMDNSFCYTGISNHLLQNYATIFVSPCASQCLNIILEEFSKVDWVNQCISQAQVISKFVYNNSPVLDLLRKLTGGQDIIRSGVTRSVSNFLSLQRMITLETDPIALEDIDMMSEWVEEAENPSPAQWLDRFGTALDGGDLNTRQFGGAIFSANDHNIFGL
uniref:At1g79740 n=1 Tax=Arabidopsis thaliana TaxID=3702 RepID=Q6NLF2_ARATH|nr:At1g79740 [Arabidopsis thaliana]AAS88772.1 At1g79740 [Arabidopsis thaliana]